MARLIEVTPSTWLDPSRIVTIQYVAEIGGHHSLGYVRVVMDIGPELNLYNVDLADVIKAIYPPMTPPPPPISL